MQFAGRAAFLPKDRDLDEPLDVAVLRGQVEEGKRILKRLMVQPLHTRRQALYPWVEHLFGIQGVLGLAAAEVDALSTEHADASLDSELSVLWRDRGMYPLGWR